jgi:hypothetical protein
VALPDFRLTTYFNVVRDPVSGTLFVYFTPTGSVNKTFRLSSVYFANLPGAGTKFVDNAYFTIEVVAARTPPNVVQVTLKDAAFTFEPGRALGAAFIDAISAIQGREGAGGVVIGATEGIRAELALQTPATFPDSLWLSYSYLAQRAGRKEGYVDLVAGMRVRVESEFSQLIPQAPPDLTNGYVTAGSACFSVASSPGGDGRPVLGFDEFLASLPIPAVPRSPGGVGGLIDLSSGTFRRRHLRLCYPATFPAGNSAGSRSLDEAAALLGADTLSDLATATTNYYNGETPVGAVSSAFFRGRTVLVPEVLAFVNGSPNYVPVGTTCRNLISRYAPIPRVAGITVSQFSNRFARYVPLAANAGGTEMNAWQSVTPGEGTSPPPHDAYDFPVLAGDSIKTGNAV